MKNVNYTNYLKNPNQIPESVGTFLFLKEGTPLFVKSTENLKKFISLYTDINSENVSIKELADSIDRIDYLQSDNLLEAFIKELLFIDKYKPIFTNKLRPWISYVYLGVRFTDPPYLKISSDTLEDYIYIGPFRSSFLLNDTLDIFADTFKLPRCKDEMFPCDRLNDGLCLGFCQNKLIEALPEMINRLLIVPNKEAVLKLNSEHDSLLNDLQFFKADALNSNISIIKKFYKNILFTYTSQYICGEFKINNFTLITNNGVIEEIVSSEEYLDVMKSDLSFRKENELLAYDKSEYDHRWILFNFLYQVNPDLIENLFVENLVFIQQKIFNYKS